MATTKLEQAAQDLKDFLAFDELSYEGKEEYNRLMDRFTQAVINETEGHPEREIMD